MNLLHPGRKLQQVEAFPVGQGEGIVCAAPVQANYIIEYCIYIIIRRRYRAHNSTL